MRCTNTGIPIPKCFPYQRRNKKRQCPNLLVKQVMTYFEIIKCFATCKFREE